MLLNVILPACPNPRGTNVIRASKYELVAQKQISAMDAKKRLIRKIRPRLLLLMDATVKEPAKAPRAEILIKSPCLALDSARDKKREPITGTDVNLPKVDTSTKKRSFAKIGSRKI